MLFNDEETASICLVDSLETALDIIKTYELETRSSFSVRSSKLKSFGHTAYDPLKRHRICWEEKGGNGLPFSQVPFIVVNCMFLDCARGPDRHRNLKKKRDKVIAGSQNLDPHNLKKRFRISKKEDCPAAIQMKEIVFFPEYSISENTRSRKERMSKTLRDGLKSSRDVIQERKIILHLPAPSKHTSHTVCQKPQKHSKIDIRLKNKIAELIDNFITDPEEIRKRLLEYVKNVLMPNCTFITEKDRRFYPTCEDVRNQVDSMLKKHRMSGDNPEVLAKVIGEHAYANSDNQVFIPLHRNNGNLCLQVNEEEVEIAVNEILPIHAEVEGASRCVKHEIFEEYSVLPVVQDLVAKAPVVQVQTLTKEGVAEILKAAETLKKKVMLKDAYLERTLQVKRSIDDAMASYKQIYESTKIPKNI